VEGVTDVDVDFGPVERTVARAEVPFTGVVLVESMSELLKVNGGGLTREIKEKMR